MEDIKYKERIENALNCIHRDGGIDGAHHKQYLIDQILRELTGCPMETKKATANNGKEYEYKSLGESDEYISFIKDFCNGEEGPNTYSWETGTPA